MMKKSFRTLVTFFALLAWNLVSFAQDAESAQESNAYGPMFAILLGGILVILVLGFLMNARDTLDEDPK